MVVLIEMGRGAAVIVKTPARIEGKGEIEIVERIEKGIETEVAIKIGKTKAMITGVGTETETGRTEAEKKIETGIGEAEIEVTVTVGA